MKNIRYISPPMRCHINKLRARPSPPKLTVSLYGFIEAGSEDGENLKAYHYMSPLNDRLFVTVIVNLGPGRGQKMIKANVERILTVNGLAEYKDNAKKRPLF